MQLAMSGGVAAPSIGLANLGDGHRIFLKQTVGQTALTNTGRSNEGYGLSFLSILFTRITGLIPPLKAMAI